MNCRAVCGFLAALVFSGAVVAEGTPVHMIVPFPPGGGADALARLLGPRLAQSWDRQVLIDIKPGASGRIGADLVAHSPADGATLLMSSTASLTEKNVAHFAPVSLVSASPYVLAASPQVKAQNVQELIALARA